MGGATMGSSSFAPSENGNQRHFYSRQSTEVLFKLNVCQWRLRPNQQVNKLGMGGKKNIETALSWRNCTNSMTLSINILLDKLLRQRKTQILCPRMMKANEF